MAALSAAWRRDRDRDRYRDRYWEYRDRYWDQYRDRAERETARGLGRRSSERGNDRARVRKAPRAGEPCRERETSLLLAAGKAGRERRRQRREKMSGDAGIRKADGTRLARRGEEEMQQGRVGGDEIRWEQGYLWTAPVAAAAAVTSLRLTAVAGEGGQAAAAAVAAAGVVRNGRGRDRMGVVRRVYRRFFRATESRGSRRWSRLRGSTKR